MAETKNVIKKNGALLKNEEITPMIIPVKEIVELSKEIPVTDDRYRKIVESAASLGIVTDEKKEDIFLVAQSLVDKLLQVDENFRLLAQSIENDEHLGDLISLLCQGATLETALQESEILIKNTKKDREDNFNKSLEEADQFCSHHNLEHSTVECFIQFIENIVEDVTNGKITQELLSIFWKSFSFDDEMNEAFNAGLLKGRNMKIEDQRSEREEDDGLGSVSAGAAIDKNPIAMGYIERIIKNKR